MARPSARIGTLNRQFRRRYPVDIRRVLDSIGTTFVRPPGWGKEGITLTLGTAEAAKAKTAHARIAADVEERFAALRAGPRRLSHKEAVSLSGDVYRALVAEHEDNPGEVERWTRNEGERLRAVYGHSGNSLEQLLGPKVDALLATKALWIDSDSRTRLLEQVSAALMDGHLLLMKRAGGDYTPDTKAARFPNIPILSAGSPFPGGKLTLGALFERWERHPEQRDTAPRTKSRYRSVFDAVSAYLKNPDAREVTTADLQRYVEARMGAAENPLSPRAARDVHKAAISSVYGWALSKSTLTGIRTNPASDVGIRVVKPKATRSKGLTDPEARRLVSASLGIKADAARPGTVEAARRWAILICFYTGSRIGAVAQLRRVDVAETGTGATIRFTPEAGEGIKGDARTVPVHPRLVALGFLDFVRGASAGPLFFTPGQRRKANAMTAQSDLLARDLAEWAGGVVGSADLKKVLHAIRHRFMTSCRHAGIEEQYVEAIAGHSPGSQNRQYGDYPLVVLARELSKLESSRVEGAG